MTDAEYEIIKSKLVLLGFWDVELAQLEADLNKTALNLEK
jgi:hypothetical protein